MDLSEGEEKEDNNEHFSKTSLRDIKDSVLKKKEKSHSKATALEEEKTC